MPVRKHQTRLTRLEHQRQKLELLCAETGGGFEPETPAGHQRSIKPDSVLRSRPLPAKYANLPANPFMVMAVFEDLKYRWNWANITSVAGNIVRERSSDAEAFPWAGLAEMVSGEADSYCAHTASRRNSVILTDDSDLLLHDLGSHGSLVFLDSVELTAWDSTQPSRCQLKAAMLSPSLALGRLGISSLISFAYRLRFQPEKSLLELLQQSKDVAAVEELPDYDLFADEYRSKESDRRGQSPSQPVTLLDNRLSELYWQYKSPGRYAPSDQPHIYLPILLEDCTRRCAWAQGRDYRCAAYSILNFCHPHHERHSLVIEFVRRGQRVVPERIQLQDEKVVSAQVKSVELVLESLESILGPDGNPIDLWTMFALLVVYDADVQLTHSDIQRLEQFLDLGYMGERLEWADIHLAAQMHAVLYSLRLLKQVVALMNPAYILTMRLNFFLLNLPPLCVLMKVATRQRAASHVNNITTSHLSCMFRCLWEGRHPQCSRASPGTLEDELRPTSQVTTQGKPQNGHTATSSSSNIFELLREQ